jgi:hypothetical protein
MNGTLTTALIYNGHKQIVGPMGGTGTTVTPTDLNLPTNLETSYPIKLDLRGPLKGLDRQIGSCLFNGVLNVLLDL